MPVLRSFYIKSILNERWTGIALAAAEGGMNNGG